MPSRVKSNAAGRLEHQQRDQAVDCELAIEEPDPENQPAPVRTIAGEPQQHDVEEGFDVSAAGFDELCRGARRWQHKEQARARARAGRSPVSRQNVRSSSSAIAMFMTSSGSFSVATDAPATAKNGAASQASTASM